MKITVLDSCTSKYSFTARVLSFFKLLKMSISTRRYCDYFHTIIQLKCILNCG